MFFYVSYIEKSKWSGTEKYPDIELANLNDYDSAVSYIEEQYDQLLLYRNHDRFPDYIEPSIITNDLRLIVKFRTAFSQTEFELWCGLEVKRENNREYFNKGISGIKGRNGKLIYEHFQAIIQGEISKAETYKVIHPVYDEQLGYVGEDVNDKGWQVTPQKVEHQKPAHLSPVNNESDRIIWWTSLSPLWRNIFKKTCNKGFYLNIPTKEVLSKIFDMEEFDIRKGFISELGGSSHWRHKGLDITPLSYLKKLKVVDLRDMEVVNVEQIGNLINLTELNLEGNNLKSIEFSGSLTDLAVLNISNNSIQSLHGIERCSKLRKLNFANNNVSSLWPLYKLPNLKELNCSRNKLKNLIPLPSIQKISAGNNLLQREEVAEFIAANKFSLSLNDFLDPWDTKN
ncbi:leucine-rich repeat domain-containing protein [Salinimicrobium xinjiangense]|uniref:leucine-rich repeat domain-containing protein n=1 Tax=Salinimicrobium xinjiangense TaxID=438596 RepID=UPI00040165A1|nr:leucine-rich repeat domain-containing protein [Salinimicrobium xinjiangense]